MKHKDDGEKLQKDKKITSLSQHMKITGYFPLWDDVRIIYRENNWKKSKFKEVARTKSHNNWWIKKMKERPFPIYGT